MKNHIVQMKVIYPDHILFEDLLSEFLQSVCRVNFIKGEIQVAGTNKSVAVYELNEGKVI